MTFRAIIGSDIFDGQTLYSQSAFLLEGETFRGIVPLDKIPPDFETEATGGGTILPGFVDLQVNGGGGVMFNDETSVDGLQVIAQAHARTGTRALLPTLITDTPERTRAAVEAVETAIAQRVPGILGIHLEGPHLSIARKGAHDPELIRPMEDEDEAFLLQAAQRIQNFMVTLAPENVRCDQIKRLSDAGVVVSLGHSDCNYDQARAAFDAGARCVTHLFNAMSQMGSRAPGLVGAALNTGDVSAGLIADDIHVHAASMRVALNAKQGTGDIFLVTDAMSTAGSDITQFELNGRTVLRNKGRLTLQDGTLAGADLDFAKAISVLLEKVGADRSHVLAMATSVPARLLAAPATAGSFLPGRQANAIMLDRDHNYLGGC